MTTRDGIAQLACRIRQARVPTHACITRMPCHVVAQYDQNLTSICYIFLITSCIPRPPSPHPSSCVTSDEMQKLRVSLSETINRNRSILNDFDHSLQVYMFAKMVFFCVLCERVCAVRFCATCSRAASLPHRTPYEHPHGLQCSSFDTAKHAHARAKTQTANAEWFLRLILFLSFLGLSFLSFPSFLSSAFVCVHTQAQDVTEAANLELRRANSVLKSKVESLSHYKPQNNNTTRCDEHDKHD